MKKNMIRYGVALLFCVVSTCLFANPISEETAVQSFIDQMVLRDHFDKEYLEKLFRSISLNPTVINKSKTPKEHWPWYLYKQIFLTDQRLQNGLEFWDKYRDTLDLAEQKYGVPPYIIIAILGIESSYGQHYQDFPVIESLSSLAFSNNLRAGFFENELRDFLILCQQYHLDPLRVYGSYAGAMGPHQFMPTSILQYQIDLHHSNEGSIIDDPENAIVSIANFLRAHGWSRGGMVAVKSSSDAKNVPLLKQLFSKKYSLTQLTKYGIKPSMAIDQQSDINVFTLQEKEKSDIWLGLHNLDVLTHYNTNLFYAMVVILFGKRIEKAHQKQILDAKVLKEGG